MLEKNVREGGLFFYYIIIKPQKIDERYKFDLHELDGIMAHGMHVRKRVEEERDSQWAKIRNKFNLEKPHCLLHTSKRLESTFCD